MKHTSLDKALHIIDAVAEEGGAGVRRLSQITGYPVATVHRILSTLVRNHYFRQNPANREDLLSIKFLELGARFKGGGNAGAIARPIMQELMESSGETVNLVVYDEMRAVYVEQVSNTGSMLRMFTQVGASVDLYCSGVGKAFLAALGDEEVLAYFGRERRLRFTPNTIVEGGALLRELKKIRQAGYAVDNEEQEEGVRCVAAAIALDKCPRWGLSVSGPSSRLTLSNTTELGKHVRRSADEITKKLKSF